MNQRHLTTAALVLAGILTAGQARAAVEAVTAITTTPALNSPAVDPDTDGHMEFDAALTSVTTPTTTYTLVIGPTTAIINTGTGFGNNGWFIPVGEDATGQTQSGAVSGLNVGSGVLDGDAEFTFAGGITLDTRLVIMDNGANGDAANVYAIDAAGNRLAGGGSHVVSTSSASSDGPATSPPDLLRVDLQRESGGNLDNRNVIGVVFSLRDLGFDENDFGTGELATLSGFETLSSSFDIILGGVVVPEPATMALLGVGGLLMIARRRA